MKLRQEKTLRDYQERYATNENDTTAKSQIDSITSKISDTENQLNVLSKKIAGYENLTYSDDLFKNLQTKAKIINQK